MHTAAVLWRKKTQFYPDYLFDGVRVRDGKRSKIAEEEEEEATEVRKEGGDGAYRDVKRGPKLLSVTPPPLMSGFQSLYEDSWDTLALIYVWVVFVVIACLCIGLDVPALSSCSRYAVLDH